MFLALKKIRKKELMDQVDLLTYNTKRMEVEKKERKKEKTGRVGGVVSLRPLSARALNLDGLSTHLWPHRAFCRLLNRWEL